MSRLISIDQSLSKTALLEWEDGVPVARYIFRSGSEETKKKLSVVTYFNTTDEQIEYLTGLMVERVLAFKPSHIVMEGLAFGAMGNATRDLAGFFYVMRNAFYQIGYDWNKMTAISPTSIKALARGYLPVPLQTVPKAEGRKGTNLVTMEKPLMIAAVPKEHQWIYDGLGMSGMRAGKDDIADAYWLGIYYDNLSQGRLHGKKGA